MTVAATTPVPSSNIGRHVFGVAALAMGAVALVWHDAPEPHLLRYVVYVAAVAQIVGGAAIVFRRSATTGAAVLAIAFLASSLLTVPGIVAGPLIYNSWGNFFEQFSLLTGATMVFVRWSSLWPPETLHRIGRILLGLCSASFALEQAFYFQATVTLVPKWIPPSQTFWAIATTVAFGLAAIALLTSWMALLAARLLTMMIVGFGILVWIPLTLSGPHSQTNWSENAENFAIAGAIWILADLLGE